ncbi:MULTISPECIES: hypothetical protein [Streptomyces]|jgi:hypothetical protein|uniref:Uncharacterized protein n=2 Tax=Streptomyces TaxID=1883 RepID=A0A1D8G7E6_9ACTN|nr:MULTISPECIES: hypothetical protein [Streptomyces]AOT61360.1 hypothetical protein A4G23_04243 [Streptomyces rubrolavendulae]KAF0648844.1 hypothetical protein K701_15955 [Streptomyces fradiae ATCC 10745 = DSM 40063]OSY49695.1 hypothetical protein BG846_04689 [Streptomyces fradiae ATCC 10745 = DSM 40063]
MADLERGAGALRSFQSKINALLTDFETGPGGPQKVAEHTIERGSFSGTSLPFGEADGFFTQYARVHKELVSLSKLLADQMELLRLGARAADVGFDNVDEDTRRRFHAIQARLDTAMEQREKQDQKAEAPDQPRTDMPNVSKDLG